MNQTNEDVLVNWFKRGFDKILEGVFMDLPPNSMSACLEVNQEWKEMIIFYRKIRVNRFRRKSDKCEKPTFSELDFQRFERVQHLVGDESHLALSTFVKTNLDLTVRPRIFVFDSKTFCISKVFDIYLCLREFYPL